MERSISSGESKYETACAIFILRIVFNQLAIPQDRRSNLLHGDAPNNALVDGMPGKLKLTRFDLLRIPSIRAIWTIRYTCSANPCVVIPRA